MEERSPKVITPRLVTNPVLLSGIAKCGSCGGGLMLATGKSGRYRYYACAARMLKGRTGCSAPIRMPEAKLDALTDGNAGDTKDFRDHQEKLERRREELGRLISLKERDLPLPVARLTMSQVTRCGEALTGLLKNGPSAFRKEYLKLLVKSVEVTEEHVKISGSRAALAAAVQAQTGTSGEVPGIVPEWCPPPDSNRDGDCSPRDFKSAISDQSQQSATDYNNKISELPNLACCC